MNAKRFWKRKICKCLRFLIRAIIHLAIFGAAAYMLYYLYSNVQQEKTNEEDISDLSANPDGDITSIKISDSDPIAQFRSKFTYNPSSYTFTAFSDSYTLQNNGKTIAISKGSIWRTHMVETKLEVGKTSTMYFS